MKKQRAFTLIELMVVMAIIAILATAGLAAYGGYLKKARDATRLEDVRALENVAVASFSASGEALDYTSFLEAVDAMNNGVILTDPMDEKEICLDSSGDYADQICQYYYSKCVNGGYVINVTFESKSNHALYTQDKLNAGSGAGSNSTYDIGNCDSASSGGAIR